MVDSLSGWNVMQHGQKFNNTLWDSGGLTFWMKCDATWSEIQQHLVRRWWTHFLDEMWCNMVRNSTAPCETMVDSLPGQNVMRDGQKFNNTLQDDSWLTPWTKCDERWSEIQQHLARPPLTHFLDKMWCKMVRNSTTPYKMRVDSLPGQNVMWDGQKFNNTLQDHCQLTIWTKCDARWSEIQQHLVRQRLTHSLDEISHHIIYYLMPFVILQHLPARNHLLLASSQHGYHYPSLYFPTFIQYQQVIPLYAVTYILWHHESIGSENPLIILHSHPKA